MMRSKVIRLPDKVKNKLDRRLIASRFGEYISHSEWLARQGYPIGKSALHRYGMRLEHKLAVLALAGAPVETTIQGALAQGRLGTGVLVIVIDPVTRQAHTYAAPNGAAAIKAKIERALLEPASSNKKTGALGR